LSPPNLTTQLLREHIANDAPLREASVAKFMAGAAGVSAVLALVLMPMVGMPLALSLFTTLAVVTGYYLGLVRAIARGWFRPAVSWLNVGLEVSIPALIFLPRWYFILTFVVFAVAVALLCTVLRESVLDPFVRILGRGDEDSPSQPLRREHKRHDDHG
jgi:hypothetical protein